MKTQQAFDIAIVGAGPGGTTCALALRASGLRVALIDRSVFPRDKTCGDALPGPAIKLLRSLSVPLGDRLEDLTIKERIERCEVHLPSGRPIVLLWATEAYNSPRLDFDNYLLDLVKAHTETAVLEGMRVREIRQDQTGVLLSADDGTEIRCKLVIGCDGAGSRVARSMLDMPDDRGEYCTAVRAYYSGIDCPPDLNRFHVFKNRFPGYFWVFPVGAGRFNVGFGMLSDAKQPRAGSLKKQLLEIIETEPALQPAFGHAKRVSEVQGYGLPLGGGRPRAISGERCLLVGDAAHLVDPLQGHGIDKAMISGQLAAEHAVRSVRAGDFSAASMRAYDMAVDNRLGSELRRNHRIMQTLYRYPGLMRGLGLLASRRGVSKRLIKAFYTRPRLRTRV